MEKEISKVYINTTNHCNYTCPFCCMWSSPQNNNFLSFNKFKEIVDNHLLKSEIIVQLEGGEPTLHPEFYLQLNYLCSLKNILKIVIDTNGSTIKDIIGQINFIAMYYQKKIEVKMSDNEYIRNKVPMTPIIYKNLITACEFVEYVELFVNLRAYTEETLNKLYKDYEPPETDPSDKNLHMRDFRPFVSKFVFNKYGRAENDNNLLEPYITRQWNKFYLYDSNGICHDENMINRSTSEKEILKK